MAHPLVVTAREAIRRHLAGEAPPPPIDCAPFLPWGVFVSLHDPATDEGEGQLRGCIGNLDLRGRPIEREVARVAVSSATTDPRFPPVRLDEVDNLEITVYLLDPPEAVDGPADLDPRRFGVIVSGSGGRRGLLLPKIPGITTAETQVALATRKAGLRPESKVTIERFTAQILH